MLFVVYLQHTGKAERDLLEQLVEELVEHEGVDEALEACFGDADYAELDRALEACLAWLRGE